TSRHYEICKYYSLNEHTAVPDILVIGKVAWESLSEEEQGWLKAAVKDATVEQRRLWQIAEKEALEAVTAAGVEIIRPEKTSFSDQVQPMLEAYGEQPRLKELIQRIQATGVSNDSSSSKL
ncbi:MAG: TRAP transporter substrate-binding protein DctP, partial [Bacteroidota bacterium]